MATLNTGDVTILVNGAEKRMPDGVTIAQLLESFDIKKEGVVVEHNLNVVLKKDFETLALRDNDRLEIVRFVGGG